MKKIDREQQEKELKVLRELKELKELEELKKLRELKDLSEKLAGWLVPFVLGVILGALYTYWVLQ